MYMYIGIHVDFLSFSMYNLLLELQYFQQYNSSDSHTKMSTKDYNLGVTLMVSVGHNRIQCTYNNPSFLDTQQNQEWQDIQYQYA